MHSRSTRTRIIKDGVVYFSIGAAAKLLGTNVMTVRRLMGERQIDWLNLRENGRLVIPESRILDYKRRSAR
jgi:hypothetical protein